MTYKLAVLACIMLFANLAFAHGNEKHVIGTVTKVSQGSVTVETTANTTVEVTIISDTKFTKGDSSATPKDLLVGDRVVIHAVPTEDGKLIAHTVQIGVAKASVQSH
jgi:Domain of unknown function (DUF5666)